MRPITKYKNIYRITKTFCYPLPTKVRLLKAMVFPIVMYGYESWTIKKAERQRIEISPECSLEG